MPPTRHEHESGWIPHRFVRHEDRWRDFDRPSARQRIAYDEWKGTLVDDPYAVMSEPAMERVEDAEPRFGQPHWALIPNSIDGETVTVCTFAINDATHELWCLSLDNYIIEYLLPAPGDGSAAHDERPDDDEGGGTEKEEEEGG